MESLLKVRMPLAEKKLVIKSKEFARTVKTNKILIDVNVISEIFKFFLSKGFEESACLLRGKINGEYLMIKDAHKCKKSIGSRSSITIDPKEFTEASAKDDGYYIVGWAHTHPSFTVFMSGTDRDTQNDFQEMFPDSVALVMNPLHKNGMKFKFFRIDGWRTKEVKCDYLVSGNEEI